MRASLTELTSCQLAATSPASQRRVVYLDAQATALAEERRPEFRQETACRHRTDRRCRDRPLEYIEDECAASSSVHTRSRLPLHLPSLRFLSLCLIPSRPSSLSQL